MKDHVQSTVVSRHGVSGLPVQLHVGMAHNKGIGIVAIPRRSMAAQTVRAVGQKVLSASSVTAQLTVHLVIGQSGETAAKHAVMAHSCGLGSVIHHLRSTAVFPALMQQVRFDHATFVIVRLMEALFSGDPGRVAHRHAGWESKQDPEVALNLHHSTVAKTALESSSKDRRAC